jgi:hypothetical protein
MFTKYIYHIKGTPANLVGIIDDALDAKGQSSAPFEERMPQADGAAAGRGRLRNENASAPERAEAFMDGGGGYGG